MLSAEDVDVLVDEIKSLRGIVVDLQLKVHELEQRPLGLVYRQMWNGATTYHPDQAVTDSDSLWICIKTHSGKRPRTHSPEFWRLGCRAGKDGKDGVCKCSEATRV